jgi:DNA-binding MarR family transcriptional regulator
MTILQQTMRDIFAENEPYYYGYKNLMTDQQWNLLKAIAQEGEMKQINQKNFLNKYHLSASSVQRSIKALEERELVIHEKDAYQVYDVFMGRWLANKL